MLETNGDKRFDVELEWIGGNCPIQAEGTIGEKRFYFRARGNHWSVGIGDTYAQAIAGDPWEYAENYKPGEDFAAGWMEVDEAKAFLKKGLALYKQDVLAGRLARAPSGGEPKPVDDETGIKSLIDKVNAFVALRRKILMEGNLHKLAAFHDTNNPNSTVKFDPDTEDGRMKLEISLHKARTGDLTLPLKMRKASAEWLRERGFTSLDRSL